jgi:hypothetical protein
MLTIINYATAFWSVVVMNCIQPANWQYCYRVDQWLVPDLIEGAKIMIYEDYFCPYCTEKKYLEEL